MLRQSARSVMSVAGRRFNSTAAAAPAPAPVSVNIKKTKKVGAFRGGFVGFLVGTVLTGAATYTYLLDEYRAANNAVVGEVVSLNQSVSRLEAHVKQLESQIKK
ncbi:uncharacterized protein SAPINGB_P000345 [Magnusiomyces paraingens]|uniref:Uncharacterized protein n=1 Tax=Magnusiomyces paraingens TaxID=2606893 RepID=A0A5E8AZW2_9ASCO|nr:uncharacterized protein SAPINGB_P000345 [Saprochaete ingens]VVT44225.1 unnamed protein product [Saprochaete ingens]